MRILYVPWLSIIFCCWIHLNVDTILVSGHIVEEQQSLLNLKKSLKFMSEKSSKLVSWHESIDCCEWSGVTCDNKEHVVGIDLSGESISGGFDNSSSLFSLQSLQRLNLASNNFNSVIPSGFNKLKDLTHLNLSHAGFVGKIPIDISLLTRLVTLDLSSLSYLLNQSLALGNQELQKLFQNLTSIRQLYLDGVSVTSKGHEWCNALLQLDSLQELSMSNCNLSGPLDSSLARLKNLSVIRLGQNNLSSTVPETFVRFSNLKVLQLSYCGLTGEFPRQIFQIETLSVIDISSNTDLSGSFPEFPVNGSLQTLIVSNTGFSGALPVSIRNLQQLSILDLSNCQFNGTLPSSMSILRELTYLDLRMNDFTGPIPSLNMSMNLSHLDLSHNHFTGSITSVHLEGLRKLVQIDLQNNSLNGIITPSIFALPMIQSIELCDNSFEGQLPEFSNISHSKLEVIDLRNNNLEGPIPTSFFNLRSLGVLQLSSNKLSGRLNLDVIKGLANLTSIDLSNNNLSVDTNVADVHMSTLPKMSTIKLAACNLKEFPTFLRNQSKLSSVDLSRNHIQGSIPIWIWKLGSLTQLNLSYNLFLKLEGPVIKPNPRLNFLDLHSNRLQGQLPIIPVNLAYLDYSSNNFSSTVPQDIGFYLSSMIYLSLSKNNLSGSIPQSLCNNTNLLVLDVSYNHFTGTIPNCLTNSETLTVLNLQHNMLYGNIPSTYPEACALRTLDLNGNQLEGSIPSSLTYCTSLEVLDLGNNQITDIFPCFLKNKLSGLRVMVLRGNNFHGHIGCPNTNGTWHMLQIVDLAFNNFTGSLPGNCFKTWEAMMVSEGPNASKSNHIESHILQYNNPIYYHDSVTLTIKGYQLEFVKILNVLTSVDFSSNKFQGPIPEELMNFTRLRVLNLSHNDLNGTIPSMISNLKVLESLDLSSNHIDGAIPSQLASLTFLSYLNLSFNQLMGKIPMGTQLQTFEADSFIGNEELCGIPLNSCSDPNQSKDDQRKSTEEVETDLGVKFAWTSISIGVGFGVGAGLVVAPCMFWKKGKKWSNHYINQILLVILPMFGLSYTPIADDDSEEDNEENNTDMEMESDYSEDQDDIVYNRFQRQFCVLCSKLDITKMKVIHDPRCTCFNSPTVSTSSYQESYSS